MKSYYLRIIDFNELKRLKKSAKFFERYKYRAVLVTSATVPSSMIVKTFDGDISENRREWYLWVHSNLLEELHHEFLSKAPIPHAAWKKAVKKWEDSRERILKAQEELNRALDVEKEAAKGIVLVNGMAPLVLGDVTFDPHSYVTQQGNEVVSYRERRGRKPLDTL